MGGMAVELSSASVPLVGVLLNRFFVILVHLYEMEWQAIFGIPYYVCLNRHTVFIACDIL